MSWRFNLHFISNRRSLYIITFLKKLRTDQIIIIIFKKTYSFILFNTGRHCQNKERGMLCTKQEQLCRIRCYNYFGVLLICACKRNSFIHKHSRSNSPNPAFYSIYGFWLVPCRVVLNLLEGRFYSIWVCMRVCACMGAFRCRTALPNNVQFADFSTEERIFAYIFAKFRQSK